MKAAYGSLLSPWVPESNRAPLAMCQFLELTSLPTFADLAAYPQKLPSNIDGGSLSSVFANGETGKVVRPNPSSCSTKLLIAQQLPLFA